MQIELFNTERYGAMAKPWKRRLKARGLQLLGSLVESESLWIGELCAMEDEARDEGCPEAFDRFMNDLEVMHLPARQFRSLMPAWRYKQNPLTASKVAHLRMLGQELLNCDLFDFPLLLPIDFVPNQNEGKLLRFLGRALVEKLGDPGFDIIEGLHERHLTRLLVMS